MMPLIFIDLGEDQMVRLDTILSVDQEIFAGGVYRTNLRILGQKYPVIYAGPISDVRERIQEAMALATRPEHVYNLYVGSDD